MVAFSLWGWPIYRYGIMYLLSFVLGYLFLYRISKLSILDKFPNLQNLLKNNLDDLIVAIVLGVMIGGRLGDVIFYNRAYYSQNLVDILKIRNGGMSFVGGFIGVAIAIWTIKKRYKLTANEIWYLFDFIVLFLPLGILFGRIGNALNQELYGKVVDLSTKIGGMDFETLYRFKIIRIFENVDNQFRRNTNFLEGLWEGLILFIVQALLFWKKLWRGKIWRPGFVSGLFCILYGFIRIVLETLRDNPPAEYRN